MLFNSFSFIFFLAAVLFVSRRITSWRIRKAFLLVVSYLFYAAWNPPFVVLLWISTVADWKIAQLIERVERTSARRLLLAISLCINLGLLGYFKYGGFVLQNFIVITSTLGWTFEPMALDIILPLGISFYTFQTLSYTFDVYRGVMKPWHSFLDYAMYVTFFPQLVAGPIVRAKEFLPQCSEPRRADRDQLAWGLSLFILGLFSKMVIADRFMAPVVETVYDGLGTPGFVEAWLGTFAFSAQIFCDFSGYSTCAIGVALCLGFHLPTNFRFPYAATGFSDFWRRWHISLSSWLRDYLYIPIGGNRGGTLRTYANLGSTMLLGGLWHGAAWTFVVWGTLHGVYLSLERICREKIPASRLWEGQVAKFFVAQATFIIVSFTWVFFRANTLRQAFELTKAMSVGPFRSSDINFGTVDIVAVPVVTITLLFSHWIMRDRDLEEVAIYCPVWICVLGLGAMLFAIVLSISEVDHAFIYFQF